MSCHNPSKPAHPTNAKDAHAIGDYRRVIKVRYIFGESVVSLSFRHSLISYDQTSVDVLFGREQS